MLDLMKANGAQPGFEPSAAPVGLGLQVLLLYEDLATALRATQSLDRLPAQLGGMAKLVTRPWRLDLLREPLLAEQAAIEAAEADVILLSVHSGGELRAEARDCLTRWLDHKEDRPYSLAALLDQELTQPGVNNPVAAYLRLVARVASAEFVCGCCPSTPLAKFSSRRREASA
jgi:hypothetical protein